MIALPQGLAQVDQKHTLFCQQSLLGWNYQTIWIHGNQLLIELILIPFQLQNLPIYTRNRLDAFTVWTVFLTVDISSEINFCNNNNSRRETQPGFTGSGRALFSSPSRVERGNFVIIIPTGSQIEQALRMCTSKTHKLFSSRSCLSVTWRVLQVLVIFSAQQSI